MRLKTLNEEQQLKKLLKKQLSFVSPIEQSVFDEGADCISEIVNCKNSR